MPRPHIEQTFDEWFEQLKQIHIESLVVELEISKDAWLEYYEDDYTPADAISEDASYG